MAKKKEPVNEQQQMLTEMQKAVEEDVQTSEEAMAKAIQTLARTDYPQQLSELNEQEIRLLTAIMTLGQHFNSDLLTKIAHNFLYLRVSTKRKGRGEILAIGRAAREEQDSRSKLKRILGIGRGSI